MKHLLHRIARNLRGRSSISSMGDRNLRRRAAKARFTTLVVALVSFAACAGCFGAASLHGTWEGAIAFGFPFAIQTDSDTYSKLKLIYTTSDWMFDSLTSFGLSGLLSQQFDASGSLGLLAFNSQLLFSPLLGSAPGLISLGNSTSLDEHRYDLGTPYFVDWVSVTSITMDPLGAEWSIGTSLDGVTWDWVSGNVLPAQFSVGAVVRYISIVRDTGHIHASAVQVSVSAQSWITNVRLVSGGFTFYGTSTLATGTSGFSLGIIGSYGDNLPMTAKVSFISPQPTCSLCFDRFEGTFGFSLGCLDLVTATLKMRNPQTTSQSAFEEVSLSATGLDLGLPGITFDAELVFELAEKTLDLTAVLNLGTDACLTLYANLCSDTASGCDITGLSLYGIRVSCAWDGVSFESLSYLDDRHYVKDTYWERFTVKSVGDTCCGGLFEFSVSAYFEKTSLSLFDLAETEASLSFGVTDALTVRLKAVMSSQAGPKELVLGWLLSW